MCVPTTATSFLPSSRACELSIPCRCWLGLLLLEVRKSVNDSCDREENVISGMEWVEPLLKMLLNTHHLGDSYVIIILYYITIYFISEMTWLIMCYIAFKCIIAIIIMFYMLD